MRCQRGAIAAADAGGSTIAIYVLYLNFSTTIAMGHGISCYFLCPFLIVAIYTVQKHSKLAECALDS